MELELCKVGAVNTLANLTCQWFLRRARNLGGRPLLMAAMALLLGAGPSATNARTETARPEMRGMWVTRFEWPDRSGNAEKMRARIREIMATLGRNHFNAVYFQIRGQGDVLYPSEHEPWSPLVGGADPGFDPLAYAIDEARKHRLEFHAYINPFPAWSEKDNPPKDPRHPYNQFRQWECLDKAGKPVFQEYYYFSPGNPAVQAHVRKVILDIARRYKVDGIHLDRIRYPSSDSSHDPVSRSRFEGEGNPMKLEWQDWQRDQITRFVYDLYGELQEARPEIKLTAAVWGIYDRTRLEGYGGFSSGFHQYYQDSFAWMRVRAMDALVPMIYWPIGGKRPHYHELYADFLAHGSFGRHIYGGTSTRHEPAQIVQVLEFTRRVKGQGTVGFSHSGAERGDRWKLYRTFFGGPAPVPPMPWKSGERPAHIVGRVLDAAGQPLTDAWVRLEGARNTWLSSGDGFFAILNLRPGRYAIAAAGLDGGRATERDIEVAAGQVRRIELRFGGATSESQ